MYTVSLQSNPNNETRITLYPNRAKKLSLKDEAVAVLGCPHFELEEKISTMGRASAPPLLLDIRSEFKTKCSAHSYKRTKFGKYAKTRIMRAAGAMDRYDPVPDHYLFLTATLPSDEEFAKWAIAEDSPQLINGFKAWLSKRLQSRLEFYVWEMQERGALHFHYCIHVPDENVRALIAVEFREEWMRLLKGSEARTGVSMWGKHEHLSEWDKFCLIQTQVETVEKSVAAYMAGYCGVKKDKHSKDAYIPYYPKRWWGVSRGISSRIQDETRKEEIEFPTYRRAKIHFDEFCRYFYEESVSHKIFPHNVGVGETGVFYHTQKLQQELWQAKKTMKITAAEFPNASSFLSLVLRTSTILEGSLTGSQQSRMVCSKLSLEPLLDTLYRESLRRGTLRDEVLMAMERLYIGLSSHSSLPPSLRELLPLTRKFALAHSQNHHLMKWDRHGWLVLTHDFLPTVDSPPDLGQARTRATSEGTTDVPDSSVSHVDGEPKASALQIELL